MIPTVGNALVVDEGTSEPVGALLSGAGGLQERASYDGRGQLHIVRWSLAGERWRAVHVCTVTTAGARLLAGLLTDERRALERRAAQLERCACNESEHLRRALRAVILICTDDTPGGLVDDLAQCSTLAEQALRLQTLEGATDVYDLGPVLDEVTTPLSCERTAGDAT